ncbi:hypothetical protein F4Y93_05940 [Candidatus Poribacteria bacterium]|nr:hypothetical protein [Candidatus Poribacteria bacterium]
MRRSPRLPFVLVIFFAVVSSFGISYVFSTLMFPSRLSPLPVEFVSVSDAPARARGVQKPFDVEAFNRTIIENNLFRPLGWTPPRRVEPYRLVGTILPRSANRSATAIIETTAGSARHIVSVGDALDGSTVVISIASKSVVVESGGVRRSLVLSLVF